MTVKPGDNARKTSSPTSRLVVRLTPRGGRDAIEGWARDAAGRVYLEARVAAPAVEGAANAALVKLIARTVKRPPGSVRIVAGGHARFKHVEIDGLDQASLERIVGEPDRTP